VPIKAFDKLRPNGNKLIPFVLSLSKALLGEVEEHERNQFVQRFLKALDLVCLQQQRIMPAVLHSI